MAYERESLDDLRQRFPHIISIFISHRTKRWERQKILAALLGWDYAIDFVPLEPSRSHRFDLQGNKLIAALRGLIRKADALVIPATRATLNSDVIPKEIAIARSSSIPILPVQFDGQNYIPNNLIKACGGRHAIPTGLLRQRILEALPAHRQRSFREAQISRITRQAAK